MKKRQDKKQNQLTCSVCPSAFLKIWFKTRPEEDNERFIAVVIEDEQNRFDLNITQIVFTDFMSGAEGGVPDPISPAIGSCSGRVWH